jgi:hypothetical protein
MVNTPVSRLACLAEYSLRKSNNKTISGVVPYLRARLGDICAPTRLVRPRTPHGSGTSQRAHKPSPIAQAHKTLDVFKDSGCWCVELERALLKPVTLCLVLAQACSEPSTCRAKRTSAQPARLEELLFHHRVIHVPLPSQSQISDGLKDSTQSDPCFSTATDAPLP